MIDEIIKQLTPLINGKLIYLSQYGSHLYGLNTENSDLDFRGVYIPTLDDIILHKDKDEINEELTLLNTSELYEFLKDKSMDSFQPKQIKVDIKIFSLQKFIQLCSKADTNALDLLFSVNNSYIEQYGSVGGVLYLLENRDKLINTDRLESPITYAHKQATKYGIKIQRYNAIKSVLDKAIKCKEQNTNDLTVGDFWNQTSDLCDDKHVKLVELDNHGKKDNYLYVAGVNHQLNLDLNVFIQRLENKLKDEYFSERTTKAINNKDEVDWKALSHALRVSYEIKELIHTGNIQFPLRDKKYLLDIKQGKADKEKVSQQITEVLEEILDDVKNDKLGWKYDEDFWNEFILQEVKNV